MSTTTTHEIALANQLLSGSYFARRWAIASGNEHCTYRPMIRPAQYGALIEGLGRMASANAKFTTLASRMLASGFNPYANASQIEQRVYRAAHEALANPFDDVDRRTGPEPCRHSDAQSDWTLQDRIRLAIWCAELLAPFAASLGSSAGIGCALQALAIDNGINVKHEFKNLNTAR